MTNIEKLRSITRHLAIAHHIPGRIRLKLQAKGLEHPELDLVHRARDFQRMVESMPGILAIRPNLLALSCVVEYDPRVITTTLWEELIGGGDSPAIHQLCAQIEAHYLACQQA